VELGYSVGEVPMTTGCSPSLQAAALGFIGDSVEICRRGPRQPPEEW